MWKRNRLQWSIEYEKKKIDSGILNVFNEEEFNSRLFEVAEEKEQQKSDDNLELEELVSRLCEEEVLDDIKDLVLEIIWKELIDISDLKKISKMLKKRQLEKIKKNKNLIVEITWNGITLEHLLCYGHRLSGVIKEELEKIKKNKNLIVKITWKQEIPLWNLKSLTKLSEENLEKIKKNRDLIVEITWELISVSELWYCWDKLSKITKEELETVKESKDLIVEITWKSISTSDLWRYWIELSKITKEELETVKENKDLILEITWKSISTLDLWRYWIELSKITKEELETVKESKDLIVEIMVENTAETEILLENLKDLSKSDFTREDYENIKVVCDRYKTSNQVYNMSDILKMGRIVKNSNMVKMRDYLRRKQSYLENNRFLNDSEFKELFWGVWKYWKWEIRQWWLGYCYLYNAYEILKKMNYFEVLIKTNLKKIKNWDWWCVRLPMWQFNWQWIKVSKNEVGKSFTIPDNEVWSRSWVSINSDSVLWFRIIEIAYIKKQLMNENKNINQEYLNTWDVLLTWERLASLEGWQTWLTLKTLVWEDNIENWWYTYESEDMVFDNFYQWLIVSLSVKSGILGSNIEVMLNRNWKTIPQV